jgi:hypothetical protein
MERDCFLDAHQALEMGLVDKVLTSRVDQEKVLAPLKASAGENSGDGEKPGGNNGNNGGDSPPPQPDPKESSI